MSGLTIDKWGPGAWNTLHVVAHSYPKDPTRLQMTETRTFLLLFGKHLPCPSCRRHFLDLLQRNLDDRTLASRATLVAFMNDAHNEVNQRLGKRTWTLEEHNRVYQRRQRAVAPSNLPLVAVGGALLVTCAILTITSRKKNVRINKYP